MTTSKRCDVPSCILFVVGVCVCVCVCVCVREPVVCFCFEGGIFFKYIKKCIRKHCVKYEKSSMISKEAVGNSWDT